MKTKKKFPTLYASNLQVKELYQLTRKMDAMGDNISDWREEYYCDTPSADPEFLLAAIKDGYHVIEKWNKKLIRIETKLVKTHGKDVLREIDFVFRWKNFGRLTYAEKRKIKLNNF